MIQNGLDQPEAQYGCPIAFSFDESDIQDLIAGLFKISYIKKDHIFPFKVEKYKEYNYEMEEWFKSMPQQMFGALKKALGWHLLVACSPY